MSDPEIFIIVHRETDDGRHLRVARQISYAEWRQARFPAQKAQVTIDDMLREVGAPGGEQGLQSDARGIDTPLPRQGSAAMK